ncbi:hypothetical protein SteCoe_5041 [Stentor coeruleus]|uniref:EF-hand domain-containing protein n=1 Tax=Stentor coeruleus TaxID=5963 RepID=A0A1R2CTC0_9CILI|nr:hypothetical protein SteCoe_5041 [Stentor coeruleus]
MNMSNSFNHEETSPSPDMKYKPFRPESARVGSMYPINTKRLKNTLPTFRPASEKIHKSNSSAKIQPKSPKLNRGQLFEENLTLKMKTHTIQSENLRLKTKITQIKHDLTKKDVVDYSLARLSNRSHLIPNLKQTIKDVKDHLREKEDELMVLKKNAKCTKINEAEIELQSYIEECMRLRHNLQEIMVQKQISLGTLEYEEKLYKQNRHIKFLEKEGFECGSALSRVRDEIINLKEKSSNFDSPSKKRIKPSQSKQELENYKSEILEIKSRIEIDRIEYEQRENKLKAEAKKLRKSKESISEKIKNAETKLEDQQILIEKLRAELQEHENKLRNAKYADTPSFTDSHGLKLPNPPKLFQKIYNLIRKKQMITDVFFSIMDKNSNGSVDSDEIYKFMVTNGCKLKKKYVIEALTLIGYASTSIPLYLFQEHYEKYDYNDIIEESSSEEIVPEPKKMVKKLTYHTATPNLPEGPIIPEATVGPRVIWVEKKIPTVKFEEISGVIDEIFMKMRAAKLPKTKLLAKVFGSDFDPDEGITISALESLLNSSTLNFGNKEINYLLARFLIEPEGVSEIPEKSLKDLKSGILIICKRFTKYFNDWEVYTDEEVKTTLDFIYKELGKIKSEIRESCGKYDQDSKGWLDFSTFRQAVTEAGGQLSDHDWDIWKLEIYPFLEFNYIGFLNSIKSCRPPESSLKILCKKLNTISTPPESIFKATPKGLISAEDFIEGINKLNLDFTNEEMIELMESVKHQDNKFTLQVNISDLNNMLTRAGFKSQTISSDDEHSHRKSLEIKQENLKSISESSSSSKDN